MANGNRPDMPDHDKMVESGTQPAFKSPSWVDGLPHNFDGWGPKTQDGDAAEDVLHAQADLTWAGDTDDRHHYVWTFQRARRRHN